MSDMSRQSPGWGAGHGRKGRTEPGQGLGLGSHDPQGQAGGAAQGKCHLSPTAPLLNQLCLRASVCDFTAQIQCAWLWDGGALTVLG